MARIVIEGLSHRFSDGGYGLRSLSLRLELAALTLLTGGNGSGKTLLARHIAGLLEPSDGTISLEAETDGGTRALSQRTGIVFQEPDSQFIGQTVEGDLAFGPRNLALAQSEVHRRVRRASRLLGIEPLLHRDPHTLSGGEKRRVAIAGAVALEPSYLILDEPFANLDFPAVRDLLSYVLTLHDAGHGVLLITHDVDKVLGLVDRVVVLDSGVLRFNGTPQELFPRLREFALGPPRASLDEMSWLAR
jgi:biotin transport system ATP-binding protein